jgi:hypothetical protein
MNMMMIMMDVSDEGDGDDDEFGSRGLDWLKLMDQIGLIKF